MAAYLMPDPSRAPAHVPPELLHPIGLTEGREFLAAPHTFMAALHDRLPPIFYSTSEHGPSAWMLTKYDDVFFVLRNPEIFTTAGGTPFPRDPDDYFNIIPLEVNPPYHRQYRAVLDAMFSPKAVALLEDSIRKLANELIDQFIAAGRCEFTTQFGRPLPVCVFLDLMGLPQHMRDVFVRWAMGLLHAQDRRVAQQCMDEVTAYLQTVIREKSAAPDDGAVSAIVHGRPGGAPMSDKEIFENPRTVDFHRPRKPNLAFAGGVHSCMGAHLARLEMRVSITEFLRRIPHFRVAAGTKIEYWPGGVVGPKTLPLSW